VDAASAPIVNLLANPIAARARQIITSDDLNGEEVI
jgi:hypothetical protein